MQTKPWHNPWVILVALSIIWGSSFILIKRGLISYDPLQVGFLRVSISAMAFLPLLFWRFSRIRREHLPWLLVVGLTGSGIPAILFALAQTHISSTMAGILNSITPLFTLTLGILFFGSPLIWRKVVGVFIGLGGALLLLINSGDAAFSGEFQYGMLVVLATICYAISGNTVATKLKGLDPLAISSSAFVMVGIPTTLLLFSTDFVSVLQQDTQAWASLGFISILALVGTVLASVIFFHLIQRTNAVFGASIAYLIPIVAVGWGLLDNEPVGWMHLIGLCLILSGVYLSKNRKRILKGEPT